MKFALPFLLASAVMTASVLRSDLDHYQAGYASLYEQLWFGGISPDISRGIEI